ncbi:lysozyme inhibitor LprI family protein [Shimia sp. MMG029]|uniref:lysozyme inhibitor LprI family protein n=1 Tax=Shimia sp. MMG029 TaxID=3021978 RepID=UPI0022FEBF4B|nr:lysozyme inhibitor LprI family protein [Shimia sp. MMG029]MDA5555645.1 DUF1311 domain-containing protein [Shimia sp. MMG029]
MKMQLTIAALLLASATTSNALEAYELLDLTHCSPFTQEFEACTELELEACMSVSNYGLEQRGCQNQFYQEADDKLNDYYQSAIQAARNAKYELRNTAWQDQEQLLRASQRAWIEMRDATCQLSGEFGAVNSGADADIAECEGRLSIRRIRDLQTEIGGFLD